MRRDLAHDDNVTTHCWQANGYGYQKELSTRLHVPGDTCNLRIGPEVWKNTSREQNLFGTDIQKAWRMYLQLITAYGYATGLCDFTRWKTNQFRKLLFRDGCS